MAYAATDDVLARAGRFAGVFSVAGKRPDLTDLAAFLEQTAAIIDAKIRARGFDPGSLSAEVELALLDVNAWATLLRALPAALPGDNEADDLLEQARRIVNAAGFEELADSGAVDVFGAMAAIEAGEGGGGVGSSAGSFWDEVDDPEETRSADAINDAAAPVWTRGQAL